MRRGAGSGRLAVRDRVVLVTGAASGIGAEVARQAARAGARVLAVDVDGPGVSGLVRSLPGGPHLSATVDVRDPDAVRGAVDRGRDTLGPAGLVFANAGVTPPTATVAGVGLEDFRRVLDVNLLGVVHTYRATVDDLVATRGHLHVTGSCSAFVPGPGGAAYMVSKAGVEQLVRALRMETAHSGMTVGISLLGMIDTGLAAATLDEDPFGRGLDAMLPRVLARRVAPAAAARHLLRRARRRSARDVHPWPWAPLQLARGVLPAVDPALARGDRLSTLLADLDARERRSR